MKTHNYIAAIDIGTNSAHLAIAQIKDHNISIVDTDKAVLRLPLYIENNRFISDKGLDLLIETICHFKEIAQGFKPTYRVVATHAIRNLLNYSVLVRKVQEKTGIEIAVIDGLEEARLSALGMAWGLRCVEETFIGIDIGGGSSEIIVARAGEVIYATSIKIGAFTLTQRFAPHFVFTNQTIIEIKRSIKAAIYPIIGELKVYCKNPVIVCSGTAKALSTIDYYQRNKSNLDNPNGYKLKAKKIFKIYDELTNIKDYKLYQKKWNLEPQRSQIILAGTAILSQLIKFLDISEITVSKYGLREGLLLDTVHRLKLPAFNVTQSTRAQSVFDDKDLINQQDIKQSSSQYDILWHSTMQLGQRYHIDEQHANSVSVLAQSLLNSLPIVVKQRFDSLYDTNISSEVLLKSASWLHECGKYINFSRYHRHSSYLISNSSLIGFSQQECLLIGLITRYHRKSIPTNKKTDCSELTAKEFLQMSLLSAILRLASVANRSRRNLIKKMYLTDVTLTTANLALEYDLNSNPSVDFYKIAKETLALSNVLNIEIIFKIPKISLQR